MSTKFNRPFLLKQNRVWRLYQGGALLDKFHGHQEISDGFFPEDWVGSTTRAVNEGREHLEEEGLSRLLNCTSLNQKLCKNSQMPEGLLTELLSDEQICRAFFGEKHFARWGKSTGLLVKLLDSKVRLPLQTHPDQELAAQHLNSTFGKTECWIVLGGRKIDSEEPHVYFGFKDGVKKSEFESFYYSQNIAAMKNCLNKIYIKPGDVITIPANIIHAIGAGVFLAEIQEPSDHVFQLDKEGPCWKLSDFQVHMGLGDKIMLESIDYTRQGQAVLEQCTGNFNIENEEEGRQNILPSFIQNYFRSNFITARSLCRQLDSFIIGIVIAGQGRIESANGFIKVQKGNTFIVPFDTAEITYRSLDKAACLKVIEAMPAVDF